MKIIPSKEFKIEQANANMNAWCVLDSKHIELSATSRPVKLGEANHRPLDVKDFSNRTTVNGFRCFKDKKTAAFFRRQYTQVTNEDVQIYLVSIVYMSHFVEYEGEIYCTDFIVYANKN